MLVLSTFYRNQAVAILKKRQEEWNRCLFFDLIPGLDPEHFESRSALDKLG